ncbi:MAG: efflux RND transporter periplasmic adaptor subunit [Lewinellaceae bacterium]|nr:efflux RND transporter periplasmic adaptor subunit [Saprospiraceae bacterium]MCB9305336.1 efflux RND transporter periplasmic adaptor subunit [Lewinellaceae bacterium]MCB9356021.1 efflux RND transporter periplasmic adaptor subunit [Lewinellaceae bacterium]
MDRPIQKKKWTVQRIATGVAILAFVAFSVYSLVFSGRHSSLNVDRDKITISKVERGVFDEFIVVTGVVQPLKTYQLDAIEGGYVAQKLLDGGATVKKGDLILKLENQRLMLDFVNRETEMYDLINNLENTRLRLRQDKFALKKTLSELDYQIRQAKDDHERNAKLFADHVISEQEFTRTKIAYERLREQREIEIENQKFQEENSITQIKQLEGTLERTRLNLQMMKQNLENLSVRAPVSGLLSRVDVEIGASITAGQNIGQIDDLNGFKMRVEVDEHYISRIFPGLEGSFDFNGSTNKLVVSKVYPEVRSGRFEVDMTFEKNIPDGIRRGQSVPVRLQLGKPAEAVLLPTGGFFSDTGGNWVYVLNSSGSRAEKRDISLGRKNPQYYEVLSGLEPGEMVVTSSYENFGDKDVLNLQ